MSGWIYCITNSLYKIDDMYKLGYTSNKQTPQLVKQHLIQRYGTYFPDVECIDLFEVKQPIQAEKQLFELLKDYKHNSQVYEGDELYGFFDLQRSSIFQETDYYIHLCPDIYFSEYTLTYMIEAAKQINSKYFVILFLFMKLYDFNILKLNN